MAPAPDPAPDPVPDPAARPGEGGALHLALDGWEGPLDLLLDLARRQKVDLKAISILALVDQYIRHLEQAEALRLEIAADYLVMASWLAYLKSALLLPREEQGVPDPEELALRLQARLRRLDAMREAAARLLARDRLGRDVFRRPRPEGLAVTRKAQWQCSWLDLARAHGAVRLRARPVVHLVQDRRVMSIEQAIGRLEALLGDSRGWLDLRAAVPPMADRQARRSALAASFVAALELARTGRAQLRQEQTFGPLHLRGGQA